MTAHALAPPRPWPVALALAGLAAAATVLFQDWRLAAGAGGLAVCAALLRFPFAGLLCTAALLFVGTPSLKIVHAPGVVSQFFPAMLMLPPVVLGFLAKAADGPRRTPLRRQGVTPLAPFVLAVVTLHLAGLAWAPHVNFALGQVATVCFDAVFFWVLVAAVSDARRLRALCLAITASAVLVCATMVCGALYDWAGTIRLATGISLNFELFSEARWGRIGGLCSANQSGGFLVFATFVTIGLALLHRRLVRLLLCLLALVFLTFVVVSGSRGAILGFLGAAGTFMALHEPTRRRLLSRSTLLALALVAAILCGKPSFIDRMLVGFGYDGPLIFSQKKKSESSSNVSGSGARFRMWKQALSVMADRPELFVLGLGPGGFIWHTREPEVHSLWLAFFFDLGLLGGLAGLLGLAVLAASVVMALRRAPPGPVRTLFVAVVVAAVAEVGLHSLIDHDLTSPVSRFAWLYVAVLAAALRVARTLSANLPRSRGGNAHETPWPPGPRRPVPVGAPGPCGATPLPGPAGPGDAGPPSPPTGRP
ncbi:MAG: O-antigen ligase family protein [Solidesulfovibrio sp. DCME]|uniref:O-antigen ligase family protein n=1 Tax=Solidesulfovibrio sp. DCME TaxID=3447380 RepID=UPI003D124FE7